MQALTEHEIQKKYILKVARKLIHLKYDEPRDREIYTKLPKLEKKIDEALLSGKGLSKSAEELLDSCN